MNGHLKRILVERKRAAEGKSECGVAVRGEALGRAGSAYGDNAWRLADYRIL